MLKPLLRPPLAKDRVPSVFGGHGRHLQTRLQAVAKSTHGGCVAAIVALRHEDGEQVIDVEGPLDDHQRISGASQRIQQHLVEVPRFGVVAMVEQRTRNEVLVEQSPRVLRRALVKLSRDRPPGQVPVKWLAADGRRRDDRSQQTMDSRRSAASGGEDGYAGRGHG